MSSTAGAVDESDGDGNGAGSEEGSAEAKPATASGAEGPAGAPAPAPAVLARTPTARNGKAEIIDLCSGFGYMAMFLSEMLPPEKVSKITLVDNAWRVKPLYFLPRICSRTLAGCYVRVSSDLLVQ